MGMTSEARAKRDAEIAALAPTDHAPTEDAKDEVEIERTGFMDPDVRRGIPVFDGKYGLPGGAAIKDSRPGGELGAAKRLEQAGRDILQGNLKRTRRKDYRQN